MNTSNMSAVDEMARAKPLSNAPAFPAMRASAIRRNAAPQVKLFMRCDTATWLLAELDYDDVAFDPFDPTQGISEPAHDVTEMAA